MKVLGLISSLSDPASRARIIQYKDYFKNAGHLLRPRFFSPLKEKNPPKWAYQIKKLTGINEWRTIDLLKMAGRLPLVYAQSGNDIIWQNRLLHSHHFFWESKLSKPVVFDFDDAIWLNEGEKQVIKKISQSAMIFAGNDFLADYAQKFNKNTVIIPTTIDTNKLFPLKKQTNFFTIGWIGTESNFKYLEIIKAPILQFISQNSEARIVIISSKKPPQFNFNNKQIIFRPWDGEKENEMINEFSVGLMPLEETNWTRGKCSYKMLQYMACGKPVIVSPVGTNKEIIKAGNIGYVALKEYDWINALKEIKNNTQDAEEKGINGRNIIEKKYSCEVMTPKILGYFKSLLS